MARQKSNIHYIYKTTCLVTNRYYIGMHSTCNIEDGYMGSGKRLRYSIRKHGINNHVKEILEFCETRELLIEAEKRAITPEMITDKNCMNLKGGGTGGLEGMSDATLKNIRLGASKFLINKWKEDNFKNKINKLLLSYTIKNHKTGKIKPPDWNGKQHSNKTKKLMSEIRKGTGTGKSNSQFGTCWIAKEGINKKIKKEDLDKWIAEGWIKGRK